MQQNGGNLTTKICPMRQRPQVHALFINPLAKEEITKEMLNQLAVEDAVTEDFCLLSLNALRSTDTENCIKLRAMVKNKLMLVLMDLESSQSFIST